MRVYGAKPLKARRRFVLATFMLTGAWMGVRAGAVRAQPARPASGLTLPTVAALDQAQAAAHASGNPLIIMVSLEGCPFCKVVRESFLLPMVREQNLPIFQVDMRSQVALRDFQGKPSTQDLMIRQWGVRIAPTVLFFGKGGIEVAERLKGSYLSDFYGAYLESRIETGRKALL